MLSVGIPAILTATPKTTDVQASIIDVRREPTKITDDDGVPIEQMMVTIFLTNAGKKPGAIGRIDGVAFRSDGEQELKFKDLKWMSSQRLLSSQPLPEQTQVAAQSGYPVIEAGQSKVIDVPLKGCAFLPDKIDLEINIMSFDMKPHQRLISWRQNSE